MATANEPYSRDSNALRASVLDAALQLGFGTSRTVENWMFNSVAEEDEDEFEHAPTPALTNASTTSEESSPSFTLPTVTGRPDTAYTEEWKAHIAHPQDAHISPAPSPAKPAPKSKLRKARKDGYESDGGYMSESGKKDKAKKKEKEKKSKKGKDTDGAETEMESDGEHLSGMKKKKSKKEKKSKKDDDGYDTSDGGYLSEASGGKKKRSFFRLGSKSKKSAGSPVDSTPPAVPPIPAMHNVPLPIAGRFARSPAPSSVDLDESSRSVTPIAGYPRTTDSLDTRTGSGGSLSDMFGSSNVSMSSAPSTPTPPLSLRSQTPGRPSQQSQSSMDSVLSSPISAPAAPGPRVRFTPSTRFDGPVSLPPSPPSQPLDTSAPRRPQISLPLTSSLSPPPQSSPLPSPRSASPQPFLTRPLAPRKHAPTPLSLPVPSSPLPTTPSPVPSDYTVVPSADFIVPSPSYAPGRRSIAANNPRAHFGQYDLPPPSPPPRGPLPSVPSGLHLDPTQLPLPYSPGGRSPSPSPRSASPLFSQPIPAIQRGRETPFPARPVLPPQESSELVRRTTTAARNVVWKQQREGVPDILINVEDATDDGGSVIRADPGPDFDPHVRPDIAQFYFAHATEREGAPSGRVSPSGMPYDRDAESVYVDDDRSLYPDDARTLETHRRRSAVNSYVFEDAGQQRMGASMRASR